MGKVKQRKKSLKWDFIKYFLICVIFIFAGSWILSDVISNVFPQNTNGYIIYREGENVIYIEDNITDESITNQEKYFLAFNGIDLLQLIAIPLLSLLCVTICGTIFYRRKLEKPIGILLAASENISNNCLDFSVEASEQNELGKLCLSFEKMRVALNNNYLEMWRQVEERKHLNAAFAHDLRTPLTVLKGQSEMIAKYAPEMSKEKIISTAKIMGRHITRLEAYINKMNDIQRLEDIELQKQSVNINDFIKQIKETGMSVCKSKEFVFENKIPSKNNLRIDISIVMQVYENLLANAVRFAKNRVTVTLDLQDELFSVSVKDDGTGFTPGDLLNATKPFYKSESETNTEHLGMGLNICKILCEKHGGYLELSNVNGAKSFATFKQ